LPNNVFKRAVLIARKLEGMYEMQGRSLYNIACAAVHLASLSFRVKMKMSTLRKIHLGAEMAVSSIMIVLRAKYGLKDPKDIVELIMMDNGFGGRN